VDAPPGSHDSPRSPELRIPTSRRSRPEASGGRLSRPLSSSTLRSQRSGDGDTAGEGAAANGAANVASAPRKVQEPAPALKRVETDRPAPGGTNGRGATNGITCTAPPAEREAGRGQRLEGCAPGAGRRGGHDDAVARCRVDGGQEHGGIAEVPTAAARTGSRPSPPPAPAPAPDRPTRPPPGHHRPLHRRPRHPVRRGGLGLIPPVFHRHRECGPQPGCGPHPVRHLSDLLGERRARTDLGAAPPPLAPLHHRELPTHGRLCGRVSTQSLPDVDTDRHTGHRAADPVRPQECLHHVVIVCTNRPRDITGIT
jgi:hypothetical protein